VSRPLPELSEHLLVQCYADAERAYPREACGFLSGPSDGAQLTSVQVCENDQDRLHALDPQAFPRDGRTAYQLRFAAVQALVDSLTTASPVKVIYHSHVDAGADFSTEDRAAALHLGQPLFAVDYLVIDVGAGRVRGAKLFRFDGHDFALAIEYDGCGRLKR
jgi:proteasome lid subunit RPN8/RPN11